MKDLYLEMTKDLIEKIRECTSIKNNCDYLLDHSDCDMIIEYIDMLNEKLDKIERYIDNNPYATLELEINIKNIIHSDLRSDED